MQSLRQCHKKPGSFPLLVLFPPTPTIGLSFYIHSSFLWTRGCQQLHTYALMATISKVKSFNLILLLKYKSGIHSESSYLIPAYISEPTSWPRRSDVLSGEIWVSC